MSCVLVTLQRSIHALSEAEQTFAPRLGSGIALVGQEMASLGARSIAAASSPLHHRGSLGGELLDRWPALTVTPCSHLGRRRAAGLLHRLEAMAHSPAPQNWSSAEMLEFI